MRPSATPGLPEADPDTAEHVTTILGRVTRGDSLTGIATDLNAAGTGRAVAVPGPTPGSGA